MRHFILRLLCFGILVLMLLMGLDVFISNRLKNNTDRRFVVWNEIIQGGINAKGIIIGSSRAYAHISPAILDSILNTSTYNLGMSGSQFNRQIERYHIYCLNNKKPDFILQNIDFMSTLNSFTIGHEREQYYPYMMNKGINSFFKEPFSWYEKTIPFVRYCGYTNLLNDIQNVNPEVLYKGYVGRDYTWDGSILRQIDTLYFRCNESLKAMFLNYVQEVKNDSINLIFVYTPFYIEAINKVANLDEMYFTFDSIAKAYDVPILDYTYSYLSYDTTYFYNASHLNKQGAELFTTMLANDLDSLEIIH